MARKRRITFPEKIALIDPTHETHVRYGMNEGLRVLYRSLRHQISPQLTREIKLGVDLQSLGNVNAAVGSLGRVIQFTKSSVAGAGIVPRIRALLSLASQDFMDFDF